MIPDRQLLEDSFPGAGVPDWVLTVGNCDHVHDVVDGVTMEKCGIGILGGIPARGSLPGSERGQTLQKHPVEVAGERVNGAGFGEEIQRIDRIGGVRRGSVEIDGRRAVQILHDRAEDGLQTRREGTGRGGFPGEKHMERRRGRARDLGNPVRSACHISPPVL